MKVFTVHERPDHRANHRAGQYDSIVLVKDGFCWPALFIPAIWLIWHRMWWVLLGWLFVGVGLAAIGELFRQVDFAIGVMTFAFSLWFALEANELRRWSLARKGWRMIAIAAGRGREEAEQSFFRRALGADAGRTAAPGSGVPAAGSHGSRTLAPARVPATAGRPATGSEPVVGLFPHPD